VVGDYVTYVDFYWFELLELMNFVMEGKFYSEYPKMREYHLRMVKLPGFGQFFYSDEVQKMSFNNKHAKLNNHEVVPEFGYWNLRGRGAQIRHQLAWLGVKYTNKEYEMPIQPDLDRSAWLDHKHSVELPFTNLPYFKDGEAKLTETIAIMQYICRKYCPEMLGKDAADQGRAEMIYP
jgi:glutathione S-transferase